jgi:hypothetical protein
MQLGRLLLDDGEPFHYPRRGSAKSRSRDARMPVSSAAKTRAGSGESKSQRNPNGSLAQYVVIWGPE